MTLDREPDLDNANVGMLDRSVKRKKFSTEAILSMASFLLAALLAAVWLNKPIKEIL